MPSPDPKTNAPVSDRAASSAKGAIKGSSIFRSSKVYLPLLTSFVLVVLFSIYFFLYISSQEAYYNERAFRVLSDLRGKVLEKISIIQSVLAASTSSSYDDPQSDIYITNHLKGFRAQPVARFRKASLTEPKRNGLLTLMRLDGPELMSFRAEYSENDKPGIVQEKSFCSAGTLSLFACADVNLQPAIWPMFELLNEKFFDDVLIADSTGRVLYQHSPTGIRVMNLRALVAAPGENTAGKSAAASPQDTAPAGGKKQQPAAADERRSRLAEISEFSNLVDIKLAGSSYKLYMHPLPVIIKAGKDQSEATDSRLIICGLRSAAHVRAETRALPYTHLVWGSLVLLAAVALIWPVLKISYMSGKERLRHKHVVTLLLSTLLATALLTLTALNLSYSSDNDAESRKQLKDLANRIKGSIDTELTTALGALDAVSNSAYLLTQAGVKKWNPQSGFLARFLTDGNLFSPDERKAIAAYPFFHYMFWVNDSGMQQFKIAVEAQATPPVSIAGEPYFDDVLRGNLTVSSDGHHQFRLQPLYSPNTGQFFTVLATKFAPRGASAKELAALKVNILVTRVESLMDAVVPSGFGYAVVDRDGLVQFHSDSTRNLIEDFGKECRSDVALLALLANGSEDWLDTNYLGRRQQLFVTPLSSAGMPNQSLIAFRDTDYFNTLNVTVILVFALTLGFYAIPFVISAVTHVLWRREYPLESIWPCRTKMGNYVQVLIANLFLITAFFATYRSFDTGDTIRVSMLLGFAGALFPILQTLGGWPRIFGRALVFTVLVALTYSSTALLVLFPGAFVLYTWRSAVVERRGRQTVPLPYLYSLVTLSILLVIVVAPCCGFFKVAYESIHRLSLEREQLLLAKKLANRQARIHRYYDYELNLPRKDLEEARVKWALDRHDYAFLNVDAGSGGISRSGVLKPGWFQRIVAQASGLFPGNQIGADLRALALADPADLRWVLAAHTPQGPTYIGLERWPYHENQLAAEVLSIDPVWRGLNAWGIAALAATSAILGAWIFVGTKKVFLVDLENAPDLDRHKPQTFIKYRLIIGHPKSGKSRYAKRIPGIQLIDIATLAATDNWTLSRPLASIVGVDRFEFDIDNPETNLKKLQLLEELIYVEKCPVVLLSTIDPMFYLATESPASVSETGELKAAMQLLDRWAAVLSPFQKMRVDDITVKMFQRLVRRLTKEHPGPAFANLTEAIAKECNHTAQLRIIGATILEERSRSQAPEAATTKIVDEVLDRAETYYRVLWSACTKDERLVLFQLAQDGWANPNNDRALRELQRRQVIERPSGFRIMNKSFRKFILNSQYPEEITEWEQEGKQSLWKALKVSLITAATLVACWLVYAQQDILNLSLGYLSAFVAAGGIVIKLLSDFRGRSAAASPSK